MSSEASSTNDGGGDADAPRNDNHLQQQPTFNTRYPPNGILHVRDFEEDVISIDHSNDGNYLASGGRDKTLTITNTSTNEIFKEHSFHNWIIVVSFSPDNQVLAVGGKDSKVSFFDTNTFEKIYDPIKMNSIVWSLSFSKTSKWLFVGCCGCFCI